MIEYILPFKIFFEGTNQLIIGLKIQNKKTTLKVGFHCEGRSIQVHVSHPFKEFAFGTTI